MWFFNTKKKGQRTLKKEKHSTSLVTLIINHQNIKELHNNDSVLRFWLPEKAKQAMEEVVRCNQTTTAKYLRELFVVYLYGEHELQRMRQKSTGLYYAPPPEPEPKIRYSIAPKTTVDTVAELGKSIIPIKLYFPKKIKNDLQKVADKTNIPLSTFIREILISHLFGHIFLQERLRSWSLQEEATGNQWEEDDEENLTVAIERDAWKAQGSEKDPGIINLRGD